MTKTIPASPAQLVISH